VEQNEIAGAFAHNGYRFSVGYGIADKIVVVSITEIDKSEKGPMLFRYRFTNDGLEYSPIMPNGIYDDSIQGPLKAFLMEHVKDNHLPTGLIGG
jgi:hypothetical protein